MSAPAGAEAYSPYATVRDRCHALGLPCWTCDSAGQVTQEPGEGGLLGLWLRTGPVSDAVAGAVRAWAGAPDPRVVGIAPHCWLIPIVHEQRRRRLGLTAALALGPGVGNSPLVAEACRAAHIDVPAALAALERIARFDEATASKLALTLSLMVRDLGQLAEHQSAADGFTSELSRSYETIDLLYAFGRSMMDLRHPERFLAVVCDRLKETLEFEWLGVTFCDDSRSAGPLASRTLVRGTTPEEIRRLATCLEQRLAAEPRGAIIGRPDDPVLGGGARVLAQPIARAGRAIGVFIAGDKAGDDPQISSYDIQLLEAASGYVGAFLENAALYADQQAMFIGSLRALTASIDAKDRYTCGHSERVALVAAQLARLTGLSEQQAERIHICGLVHDVGKIGVPEAVLTKPGKLTDEEFDLIKLHPEIGHRIIRDIPLMADLLPGVLHHHERWDGRGYPHRLAGEKIPQIARILGLADTFDAMSSTRSYREALPRDRVLEEIARCAGTQFDPALAAAFPRVDLAPYDEMVARHAEQFSRPLRAAA